MRIEIESSQYKNKMYNKSVYNFIYSSIIYVNFLVVVIELLNNLSK